VRVAQHVCGAQELQRRAGASARLLVLVEGDLCKYDSLRAAMQGCRACVTCAFYEVAYGRFV